MASVQPENLKSMDKVPEGADVLDTGANVLSTEAWAGIDKVSDVKVSQSRSPTSNLFVLFFLGKTFTSLGCCLVAVFPDESMTFMGGVDWRVPKDSPGLTERAVWFGMGLLYFLTGLNFLRWMFVLAHPSMNKLLGQLVLSDEVGPHTTISKKRRQSIRKVHPQRNKVVMVNFATQLMIIPIVFLFIDGDKNTPPYWMIPVFVILIVFDLSHVRIMDPLDDVLEALAQRAWSIAAKLDKGQSISWDTIAVEYQELDALLEELSSFWELGCILLLRIACKAVLMGVGLYAVVAVAGDLSSDNVRILFAAGATLFISGAAMMLVDLHQFAQIEKSVNCRHFQSDSIVGRASSLVGAPGMSDRDRIDQLMFLIYTKENKIGMALFGIMIDQPLITSVGKQLLVNIPVLVGAINLVVAKTA